MSGGSSNEVDPTSSGHFVMGLGGEGIRFTDTMVYRREMDGDGKYSPRSIWDDISAGVGVLDSVRPDWSHYISDIKDGCTEDLAEEYIFDARMSDEHPSDFRQSFEDHLDSASSWDAAWGEDLHLSNIERATDMWLFYDPTDVNVTGVAPAFLEEVHTRLEDSSQTTTPLPVDSFPILSLNGGELKGKPGIDCLVGLSKLSDSVRSIIPLRVDREPPEFGFDLDDWNHLPDHLDGFEPYVYFLELFAGVLKALDTPISANGNGVDSPRGSSVRRESYYNSSSQILGSALATSSIEVKANPVALEGLIERLKHSQLIEFDMSTARGGVFIFLHPSGESDGTHGLIDEEAEYLIEDHLGVSPDDGPIRICQTVHAGLDDPKLLALFVDPKISPFDTAFQWTREYTNSNGETGVAELDEDLPTQWEAIRTLFGRESE